MEWLPEPDVKLFGDPSLNFNSQSGSPVRKKRRSSDQITLDEYHARKVDWNRDRHGTARGHLPSQSSKKDESGSGTEVALRRRTLVNSSATIGSIQVPPTEVRSRIQEQEVEFRKLPEPSQSVDATGKLLQPRCEPVPSILGNTKDEAMQGIVRWLMADAPKVQDPSHVAFSTAVRRSAEDAARVFGNTRSEITRGIPMTIAIPALTADTRNALIQKVGAYVMDILLQGIPEDSSKMPARILISNASINCSHDGSNADELAETKHDTQLMQPVAVGLGFNLTTDDTLDLNPELSPSPSTAPLDPDVDAYIDYFLGTKEFEEY